MAQAVVVRQNPGNLALNRLHLLPEGGGGNPEGPVAQDDELLRPVGGGHPDPVAFPQLIGGPLDIGVRRLRLLGVDHVDVVVLLHGPLAPSDLIGVKDGDKLAFPVALVVAKKVAQGLPGGVQALLATAFSSSQAKMMLYPSTSKYSGPEGWREAGRRSDASGEAGRRGALGGRKSRRFTAP